MKIPMLVLLHLIMFADLHRSNDCSKLRNGTFYFYPPDGSGPYQLIRNDSVQKEIDLKTFDTSFFQIEWTGDCTANVHLVRTTRRLSPDLKEFLFSHVTATSIINISDDYYVFTAALDSLASPYAVTDTVWLREKHQQ